MAKKDKIVDKALKFIQKGYLDKAIGEYKKAIDIDPSDISIRLRLGDLYAKTGLKDEAIKEYEEVAKTNTKKGFYLKSIAVYKQMLKLDESSLEVHSKLADLYTKQRLNADAISEYSYIVNVYEKKGKTTEAFDLIKKMVDIDPENVGVKLKLADMYQKLGFDKDAFEQYCWIFDKLMGQDKLDKADKVIAELYKNNPSEPKVLEGMVELAKKKKDDDSFVRYGKELAEISKNNGEEEKAKEVYESILEVRPGEKDVVKMLGELKSEGGEQVEPPEAEGAEEEDEALIDFPLDDEEQAAEPEESEESAEGDEEPLISIDEGEAAEEVAAEALETGVEDAPGQEEAEAEQEIEEVSAEEVSAIEEPEELESIEEVEEEPLIEMSEDEEPESVEEISAEEVSAIEEPEELESVEEIEEVSEVEEVEELEAVEEVEEEAAGTEAESTTEEDVSEIEPNVGGDYADFAGEVTEEETVDMAGDDELFGGEDSVDLSDELDLDEALGGLGSSWADGETEDTVEEFKAGIGEQLGREDAETHHNLGIAYMEMELYDEAIREFKIALRSNELSFDAYTRLGICNMAEGNSSEAISYYLKALKITGTTDEERKGLMYELGLAYEAEGNEAEAKEMFQSVYDMDPGFRDTVAKLEGGSKEEPDEIPEDDDLVEVEMV